MDFLTGEQVWGYSLEFMDDYDFMILTFRDIAPVYGTLVTKEDVKNNKIKGGQEPYYLKAGNALIPVHILTLTKNESEAFDGYNRIVSKRLEKLCDAITVIQRHYKGPVNVPVPDAILKLYPEIQQKGR